MKTKKDYVRFIRSAHWRYLVLASAALATAGAATAAAAGGSSASGTSVHTIQLVGHETQHKSISKGAWETRKYSAERWIKQPETSARWASSPAR